MHQLTKLQSLIEAVGSGPDFVLLPEQPSQMESRGSRGCSTQAWYESALKSCEQMLTSVFTILSSVSQEEFV
jgi:hypothetical protein